MKNIESYIFRTVLDCSLMGIVLHRNGEVLYSNQQINKIFEEEIDLSTNPKVFDYLSIEYQEVAKKSILKINDDFEGWMKGDYPIILKNGKHKILSTSSKIIDKSSKIILLEVTDITKEKDIERENKDYKFKMESIMHEAPISILILSEEGEIKYVNKRVLRDRKIQMNEVRGKLISDFIGYQKSDSVFARLQFAVEHKVDLKEVIHYQRRDKTDMWFELNVKYIKEEERSNFIVLVQDITEIKAMEKQIKNFNNQLKIKVQENIDDLELKTKKVERGQQAMIFLLEDMKEIQKEIQTANQKMKVMNADLESFNYSVSHDLKAPLRVITNYSNFLTEDLTDTIGEESLAMLKEIEAQGKKMSQLLSDLLYFSRFGSAKLKTTKINMKELVSALFSEEFRENDQANKFEIIIDNLPIIYGDYPLIKQVIVNLVANAVKFSQHRDNPLIHVGFIENEVEITYYFKDNGIGFSEDKSSYIFGLFNRLNNSVKFEGTGVGLSIVKRIIEKHNGSVYAKGVQGEGAEIGFVLPKNIVK